MYIGLDLGTSGARALLVDAEGQPQAHADASWSVSHPAPGWSEQDPQAWCDGVRSVLSALAKSHPELVAQVRGIATSGHMHGATLVGADGEVLRPCILWNDTRAHVEAAELDGAEDVRDLSGNIVFPGFTAPKVMWVARNEPEVFSKLAKVLLPKDYLNFWLTGEYASEMSDAAGTSWLDVADRSWSAKLLETSGMRADQMPNVMEGTGQVGVLKAEIAASCGLPEGIAVIAGGADNACAACGVGALREGDAFVSLGTSGVMLAARDAYAPLAASAVHTFCHAVPARWYQMGVVLAATDSLNWLSSVTGQSPSDLTGALGGTLKAPGAVKFFPYLSGERTPHNDSHIRGGFTGLSVGHDTTDLTQAVLAGVSFALRDSFEALKSTGASLDSALAIGGGTGSSYWTEMLATALDLPLEKPDKGEFGAALGAARLAMAGVSGATPEEIMTKPPIAATIEPNAEHRAAFEDAYQVFRTDYAKLRALQ